MCTIGAQSPLANPFNTNDGDHLATQGAMAPGQFPLPFWDSSLLGTGDQSDLLTAVASGSSHRWHSPGPAQVCDGRNTETDKLSGQCRAIKILTINFDVMFVHLQN